MKLEKLHEWVMEHPFQLTFGKVTQVRRDAIRTRVSEAKVGSFCVVESETGEIPLEVVSLHPRGHIAMPLDELMGVRLGDRVVLSEDVATFPVGEGLLGKVVDSVGRCYETQKLLELPERMPLYGVAQNPLSRELIEEPLDLGIRAINSCLTCGKGQRQGIFAGSGVGKSVLLGMMARYTAADVVVIALIGERGREVREFIERELGEEGRKKSVVVVETADKSAVRRARGAYAAATIAEYFREQGKDVLLLMDSLTRFAMAQREIGIAAGEPPTTKGYPPSVYSALSRLIERAGNWGDKGSITGLYTVLVEGDDLEDPVADSARASLDGHIVLSRRLANRGQYPAIDILASVSRVMDQIVDPKLKQLARKLKENLARYLENEDAIQYGMYLRGTDLTLDESISLEPRIRSFLQQEREERATFKQSQKLLEGVFSEAAGS